ncbi:hypothetical protein [Streptomyces smyrnaeus]|uniref:hypothetical protein n=1 Tax=Streptomyces smyrnaeus TaxID=1387713 RepID=UPI0033C31848
MTMLYTPEGGETVVVPAEDEAVLARYRDSMPMVWEVQECGPPMWYSLVDVDEEPCGTPLPGELERQARATAEHLRKVRLGEAEGFPPNTERLALAAIRGHLASVHDFAVAAEFEGGRDPEDIRKAAVSWMQGVARELCDSVKRTARKLAKDKPAAEVDGVAIAGMAEGANR